MAHKNSLQWSAVHLNEQSLKKPGIANCRDRNKRRGAEGMREVRTQGRRG